MKVTRKSGQKASVNDSRLFFCIYNTTSSCGRPSVTIWQTTCLYKLLCRVWNPRGLTDCLWGELRGSNRTLFDTFCISCLWWYNNFCKLIKSHTVGTRLQINCRERIGIGWRILSTNIRKTQLMPVPWLSLELYY